MRMWPISTRVNKPENDAPSIPEPTAWRQPRLALLTGRANRARPICANIRNRNQPLRRRPAKGGNHD
jgi:hypothetical protein